MRLAPSVALLVAGIAQAQAQYLVLVSDLSFGYGGRFVHSNLVAAAAMLCMTIQ